MVLKPDVVMMAGNTVKLNDGSKVQISVEQENGFIKDLTIEGGQFLPSEGMKQEFIEALRWVHLNQVALYTRIRFFMLKNRSQLQGIDEEGLADAICNSA